ncbi:MAG TPA: 4Fe-4S dicluster domain-containing protein [Polyangia bacterium]|jgi:ferredoxin|nr:4Fe-4S dicluster domain-containing protein [Polyangia bacterium]
MATEPAGYRGSSKGAGPGPGKDLAEVLRERLGRAGLAVPRAETVVIDLAGDPPLGRSASTIAVEDAERVVAGAGAALVAARAQRAIVAVRTMAAERAVRAARDRLGGAEGRSAVEVILMPPLWPSLGLAWDLELDPAWTWLLDGEALLDVESAALARERAPWRVTVAGVVRRPGVVAWRGAPPTSSTGGPTVETLVAATGGSEVETGPAWVALDGGAPGGRLVGRSEPVRSSLLLVLPMEHPLVARARIPVGDWLRRAASACEGCRACSDACPVALAGGRLAPHEVIATLITGRDDGVRLAEAAACLGCGVCDIVCPGALSPATLLGAVRGRLPVMSHPAARARPAHGSPQAHPDRMSRRLSIDLLLLRTGLTAYDRALPQPGTDAAPLDSRSHVSIGPDAGEARRERRPAGLSGPKSVNGVPK